jgi:hypothetical protein
VERSEWLRQAAQQMSAQLLGIVFPEKVEVDPLEGHEWVPLFEYRAFKERIMTDVAMELRGRALRPSRVPKHDELCAARAIQAWWRALKGVD